MYDCGYNTQGPILMAVLDLTLKFAFPICVVFWCPEQSHGAQVGVKAQTGGWFIQRRQNKDSVLVLLAFWWKLGDYKSQHHVCFWFRVNPMPRQIAAFKWEKRKFHVVKAVTLVNHYAKSTVYVYAWFLYIHIHYTTGLCCLAQKRTLATWLLMVLQALNVCGQKSCRTYFTILFIQHVRIAYSKSRSEFMLSNSIWQSMCCFCRKVSCKSLAAATHQSQTASLHWQPMRRQGSWDPCRIGFSGNHKLLSVMLTVFSKTCMSLENFHT